MRRPISFIATSNAKQAMTFYGDVIGLKLVEASPYALVFDDKGVMLRVQIMQELTPPSYTAHGWDVTDIEQEIGNLTAKGAVFNAFEHLDQDKLGIWTSPDGHKIAWFRDPCGNMLSLTQFTR